MNVGLVSREVRCCQSHGDGAFYAVVVRVGDPCGDAGRFFDKAEVVGKVDPQRGGPGGRTCAHRAESGKGLRRELSPASTVAHTEQQVACIRPIFAFWVVEVGAGELCGQIVRVDRAMGVEMLHHNGGLHRAAGVAPRASRPLPSSNLLDRVTRTEDCLAEGIPHRCCSEGPPDLPVIMTHKSPVSEQHLSQMFGALKPGLEWIPSLKPVNTAGLAEYAFDSRGEVVWGRQRGLRGADTDPPK